MLLFFASALVDHLLLLGNVQGFWLYAQYSTVSPEHLPSGSVFYLLSSVFCLTSRRLSGVELSQLNRTGANYHRRHARSHARTHART